ncbi:hypothetical protein BDD12DRAFT_808473 [Trichophaea hybrida]|nr:hypothetical protein BDD12DRAFT_808473 [Trichophaea hybrida]
MIQTTKFHTTMAQKVAVNPGQLAITNVEQEAEKIILQKFNNKEYQQDCRKQRKVNEIFKEHHDFLTGKPIKWPHIITPTEETTDLVRYTKPLQENKPHNSKPQSKMESQRCLVWPLTYAAANRTGCWLEVRDISVDSVGKMLEAGKEEDSNSQYSSRDFGCDTKHTYKPSKG